VLCTIIEIILCSFINLGAGTLNGPKSKLDAFIKKCLTN